MLRFHFTRLSPLFASKASPSFPLSPISISVSTAIHNPVKLRSQMASYSSSSPSSSSKLLFRQLFEKESSTYTYLLADASHPDKPALVSVPPPPPKKKSNFEVCIWIIMGIFDVGGKHLLIWRMGFLLIWWFNKKYYYYSFEKFSWLTRLIGQWIETYPSFRNWGWGLCMPWTHTYMQIMSLGLASSR